MRYKLATTCSALAPVAAYAADGEANRSKAVTFVNDSVITTKIRAKLAAEHLPSPKTSRSIPTRMASSG